MSEARMIETTNRILLTAFDGLTTLAVVQMPPDVRVKVYRLARVVEIESNAVARVRAEIKANLEPTTPMTAAQQEQWTNEITALLDGKVTISCTPLTFADQARIPELAPLVLLQLGPFFVDQDGSRDDTK